MQRANEVEEAKRARAGKSEAERIAEDYAKRLAEKALYRELLSQESQDGMRFRWYFTRIKKDTPLDELRVWIDAKINREES
jgi:hypothetical protein